MKKSELESKIKGLQVRRTERKRFIGVVSEELENAKKRGYHERADQLEEMYDTEKAKADIIDLKLKSASSKLKKFN